MKKVFLTAVCLSVFLTPFCAAQNETTNETVRTNNNPQKTELTQKPESPNQFTKWSEQKQPPSYTSQLVITVCFLIALCVLAYCLRKKILPTTAAKASKNIKITETARLSPGKNLHIVELKSGQKILIGSTNNSINLLTYIDTIPVSEAQ